MLIVIFVGSLPVVITIAVLIFTVKHNKENQISKDIVYRFEENNNDNNKSTISKLVDFNKNNEDTKSTSYKV